MQPKIATVKGETNPFSLVRHEPAIEITQKLQAYQKAKKTQRQNESKPSPQDMLNMLLPPREWKTPEQRYYMQYVSHSRPGRDDIERVQKAIDLKLMEMHGRTQGICPIREYLFSQLFDEVIRQVAIDSPQRGLMLSRVRDQRKMTIAAHEILYRQAVIYGHQKQAEGEEGMGQLQAQLDQLQSKKEDLERRIVKLRSKKDSMGMRVRERKVLEGEKRTYEVEALHKQNESLERFLSRKRELVVREREEGGQSKE